MLQVDVGNTRLKWRLIHGGAVVARGACVRASSPDFQGVLIEVIRSLGRHASSVCDVLVACVAGADVANAIHRWSHDQFGVVARFAVVTSPCSGVVAGYEEPASLGVDRWLAVLAASRFGCEHMVVVDCGSAVTVDILSGQCHLGGYIAPGLALMNSALFSRTAQVQVQPSWSVEGVPGRNTASAVNAGIPLMVAGLVIEVVRRQAKGEACQVVLTGGDAPVLAELLKGVVDVKVSDDLVFDGLSLAEMRPLA